MRQEFLAACAVPEPARAQNGGDELNSGEFSYPQGIAAARREARLKKSENFRILSKNVGKMAGFRTETGHPGGQRVRHEFLAAWLVDELARVQTDGDELNSGEFGYPQGIAAAPHEPR